MAYKKLQAIFSLLGLPFWKMQVYYWVRVQHFAFYNNITVFSNVYASFKQYRTVVLIEPNLLCTHSASPLSFRQLFYKYSLFWLLLNKLINNPIINHASMFSSLPHLKQHCQNWIRIACKNLIHTKQVWHKNLIYCTFLCTRNNMVLFIWFTRNTSVYYSLTFYAYRSDSMRK